eukprot:TRINITY_DN1196_c0_g1_i1.p1 TRINITY_DN1196_c0_g1~~TRINITY_DN1196_c0_g1_i1.p1  ORF type:complete len:123 (+),score=19.45 TRINITY_DN1196_c0_g1_i1:2-370(+)
MRPVLGVLLCVLAISVIAATAKKDSVKSGRKLKCADGARPTCKDGSAGKKATCDKPKICADGSVPAAKVKKEKAGKVKKEKKCAKNVRVCCDGSKPTKSKPPCDATINKGRPVCNTSDAKCS